MTALGGVPRVHHATLIPQAAGHLAAELAERGRLPVLLIDEAHLLSHDQLEAIRMLTSAQLDSASPLAVLLLGQPQLRASMRLGVLAALDQRIARPVRDGADDRRTAGAPRVWWRLDSPQMLWSGWPLSSTVPPPGGTTV